jgi:hypothetical protein
MGFREWKEIYENLEKKHHFFLPYLIPANSPATPSAAKGAQLAW